MTTTDTATPLPTGFAYITCVLPDPCRACGVCPGEDSDGFRWHCTDIASAVAALTESGWQVTPDGLVCDQCTARAECETRGHDWGDWYPSQLRRQGPSEFRICRRCTAHDTRPAA
ncbi:hypothetical protein ACWEHA_09590 [Amycolatopsis nivea]